jgi:hydrogenase nickel incorporation protein HypA/HybF
MAREVAMPLVAQASSPGAVEVEQMHEVGLCQGVVHTVEQRAGGRPVAALGLRVGALHRVVPDAFRQAFSMVSPGTVADGAEVEIVDVPVQATCADCERHFTAEDFVVACPACDSVRVTTEGGDELTLVWVRYRDDTAGDPAAAGSARRKE